MLYEVITDIESERAEFTVTSIDLSDEFVVNPSASEQKYLNKTIEVSGAISELNETDLTLDGSIFCQFRSKIQINIKDISIKGRFIGYDDLLEQINVITSYSIHYTKLYDNQLLI